MLGKKLALVGFYGLYVVSTVWLLGYFPHRHLQESSCLAIILLFFWVRSRNKPHSSTLFLRSPQSNWGLSTAFRTIRIIRCQITPFPTTHRHRQLDSRVHIPGHCVALWHQGVVRINHCIRISKAFFWGGPPFSREHPLPITIKKAPMKRKMIE